MGMGLGVGVGVLEMKVQSWTDFFTRGVECGEKGCVDALEGCEAPCQVHL